MRYVTVLLAGFCCLPLALYVTACSESSEVYAAEAVIQTPSLQCETCVNTVTQALEKVNGVQSATVDLENKTATVSYDPNKTSEMDLVAAISGAGYQANDQPADREAYESLPDCCKLK